MAEFLTTLGTTARIEQIISKAQERIVLISPFVRWSDILFRRLREADERGIPVVFVYGKEELRADQRQLLDQLNHLSLYFCPNLHAKCYFNEQQLLISSLNLYEASERNREMGVVFLRHEAVYREAEAEARSILAASELKSGAPATFVEPPKIQRKIVPMETRERRANDCGHCVRCGGSIPLNRNEPLCAEHEASWAIWGNLDYGEKYCHLCGAETPTTKRYPLCEPCFRKSNSL